MRDTQPLELPCGEARALQKRSSLADPDMLDQATLPRSADCPDSRAVATGREATCVAVREHFGAGLDEISSVGCHLLATLDLVLVDSPSSLGGRVGAHLVESPAEIDSRRARRSERLVGDVEILASARRQREAVRRGDTDRGRATDGKRPDRLRDGIRALAPQLDDRLGESTLVEDDNRIVLEADDVKGGQVFHVPEVEHGRPDPITFPRPSSRGTSPAPP